MNLLCQCARRRVIVTPAIAGPVIGTHSGMFRQLGLDQAPIHGGAASRVIENDGWVAFAQTINVHLMSIDVDQFARRWIVALVRFGGSRLVEDACDCQSSDESR